MSRSNDLKAKISLEVDLAMYKQHGVDRELLVNGTGIFKRLGALRVF